MRTDDQIILVPSSMMKILFGGGLFVLAAFVLTLAYFNADDITFKSKVMGSVASLVMVVVALDYLQRQYRFVHDRIQVRFLYLWKKYPLPVQLQIRQNELKQVLFQDAADGKEIIKIPKDYSNNGKLVADLQAFYRDKL